MGDIQAFSQTAIFQRDMAAFFTKWMYDIRDSQCNDGRFFGRIAARHLSGMGIFRRARLGAMRASSFPGESIKTMPIQGCSKNISRRPSDGSISFTQAIPNCFG